MPRPVHQIPIYQAVRQRADIPLRGEGRARRDFHAGQPHPVRAALDSGSASLVEQYQGRPVAGRDRMVVVQVHIGETREQAFARFRPSHDERNRFLGAQRPLGGYLDEEGKPFGFGRLPTLEESVGQSAGSSGRPSRSATGCSRRSRPTGSSSWPWRSRSPGCPRR